MTRDRFSVLIRLIVSCSLVFSSAVAIADSQPPSIKIRYNNDLQPNGTWVLGVRTLDDTAVAEVTVFFKSTGDSSFSNASYSVQDDYTWKSLPVGNEATTVSFFIQATDTSGNMVSRGSAKQPLTVDIKAPDKTTSATTTASKKTLNLDNYCKKVGLLKRASTKTSLTTKTKNKNGKEVPQGRIGAMKIGSNKRHYLYTKWSNLQNRDYNIRSVLFDSNNRVVSDNKYSFKSEWVAGNGYWTTWIYYSPKETDPTGNWKYVVCEGDKRQVEASIKVIK